MISKVINSFDIHVNTQQLRIVEHNELPANRNGFDSRALLFNEPRGSKYVNLLIYKADADTVEMEISSHTSIDNLEILLKAAVLSLVDRGNVASRDIYRVKSGGTLYEFSHGGLSSVPLPKTECLDDIYVVNKKRIIVEDTSIALTVESISEIKGKVKRHSYNDYDYFVLKGHSTYVTIRNDNSIAAYPVLEVISILRDIYGATETTSINGIFVHADKDFNFEYYLISNSQFYVDETDIYNSGFVIK